MIKRFELGRILGIPVEIDLSLVLVIGSATTRDGLGLVVEFLVRECPESVTLVRPDRDGDRAG